MEPSDQNKIDALLIRQEELSKKIERKMHVLNDTSKRPTPEIQIKLKEEIQNLQDKYDNTISKINELEQSKNSLASEKRILRDQELNYLKSIKSDYQPLIDVYTEMSIHGKKHRGKVKVKRTAQRFLEMHHDVYSQISHAFEEDESETFTINTLNDLLQIIIDYKRVALIGEPGSGKSTTLQRIAYELASKAIEDQSNPLPLYIRLGGYIGQDVNKYFTQFFDQLPLTSYLPHRIIILLDGLNEIPIERVKDIERWLELHQSVSVVVSCRRFDYIERKLSLRRIDISPLDVRQIYTFIGNFFEDLDRDRLFWALAGQEARTAWEWYKRSAGFRATFENYWFDRIDRAHSFEVEKTYLKNIQDDLREKDTLPGILGLVTIPFLLFTVIPIYMHNEEPPRNRGELFEQFIELLIEKRGKIAINSDHPWINADYQKFGLANLAHRMLLESHGTEVDESWAFEVFKSSIPKQEPRDLVYFAVSAGILESKRTGGKNIIRFSHELLQEYFAALKMGEDIENGVSAERYWPSDRWWEPTGWEETALLLAGIQRNATAVVRWLTPINPTLAYRSATECGVPCDTDCMDILYKPLPGKRTSPIARAEWGRILGKSGDPRPSVGLDKNGLPDIIWIRVPAGSFLMGGDEELKSLGLAWGKLEIKFDHDFCIAKYPITYEQFRSFVKDGYEIRKYWTVSGWRWKGKQRQPRYWDNPIFNISNHPVVGVTWYEAYAFSRWLNEKYKLLNYSSPDPGMVEWEIRLPLEAEWERAARFPDNRRYPWGNKYIPGYANIDETFQDAECGPYALRRTTAVGLYEAGKSHLEIYDMCGNIWEWCLSKWDVEYSFPENIEPEGTEHRGLRGGSWYNSVQFAPSAAHDCLDADLGVNDVGFRLVVVPIVKQRSSQTL